MIIRTVDDIRVALLGGHEYDGGKFSDSVIPIQFRIGAYRTYVGDIFACTSNAYVVDSVQIRMISLVPFVVVRQKNDSYGKVWTEPCGDVKLPLLTEDMIKGAQSVGSSCGVVEEGLLVVVPTQQPICTLKLYLPGSRFAQRMRKQIGEEINGNIFTSTILAQIGGGTEVEQITIMSPEDIREERSRF